ncbi:hypothetical protein SLE2022_141240 [Rubroshorea leprosula]
MIKCITPNSLHSFSPSLQPHNSAIRIDTSSMLTEKPCIQDPTKSLSNPPAAILPEFWSKELSVFNFRKGWSGGFQLIHLSSQCRTTKLAPTAV